MFKIYLIAGSIRVWVLLLMDESTFITLPFPCIFLFINFILGYSILFNQGYFDYEAILNVSFIFWFAHFIFNGCCCLMDFDHFVIVVVVPFTILAN